MADDILKIFAEGRIDAQSLSAFMAQPPDVLVPRRLAQPINTLNYFLDYLKAIEKVYTQQTGVVNVNGVQVKAITQAITDALNSAAIDNNTQVDTLITSTPKHAGSIARNQAQKNDDFIDIRDFTRPTDIDHTAGLQAAAAVALAQKKKLQGAGTYYIKSGDVSFRYIELELDSCEFIIDSPYKIILGGNAGSGLNPNQAIGNVRNPSFSYDLSLLDTPTLRVMGAKNQYIKIGFVQHLQFYQSTDPATFPRDASQAYSTIDVAFAIKLTIDTDPRYASGQQADGAGSANQWFNENTINLNRCYGFFMRGSYNHNHNIINGGSFEGVATLSVERGNKNHFKQIRFEGASNSVHFGENTLGNVVEKTYFGSEANFWMTPDVVDLGRMNSVRSVYDSKAHKRHIMSVTNNDSVSNKVVFDVKRTPSKKYIKSNSLEYNIVARSAMFALYTQDYLFVQINGELDSLYTIRVYLYDGNKQPIADATTLNIESNLTAFANTNKLEKTVGTYIRLALLDDTAKYAMVEIVTTNDAYRQKARSIDVFINTLRPMEQQYFAPVGQASTTKIVTGKPTEFVGALGDNIQDRNGTRYTCTHYVDTVLVSGSGANILVKNTYVSETGASLMGDLIGIELDSNRVHWTTVAAISTNNVTLAVALPSAASLNNNVYISRLA